VEQARVVDPSASRIPLSLEGRDLATVCVLCSHNCGLRVDVEAGRIRTVRADETNPISRGYVCNKAFRIGSYVEHAQRVTHPLRRRGDGGFERMTWDEAIAAIASRLDEIRTLHSPRAIRIRGIPTRWRRA
jgi:anaerobic selenocysteine-containing dehydrogenase